MQPTSSPGGQYKATKALAHQECSIQSFSESAQSRLEKPQEAWNAHKGTEQGKEVRDQQLELRRKNGEVWVVMETMCLSGSRNLPKLAKW